MSLGLSAAAIAVAVIGGPSIVLVIAGIASAVQRGEAKLGRLGLLAAASTGAWLVFVGLYPHESPCGLGHTTDCPNIYGSAAPWAEPNIAGTALLVSGFVIPAIWGGLRGRFPPLAVGAALMMGPLALVWGTAPRGDNDGLWGLFFVYVALLGWCAVLIAAATARISGARRRRDLEGGEMTTASAGDQVTAFLLDVAVVAGVLVVPLTVMSHAKLEVLAFVVGVIAATAYLSVPVWMAGRTLGQFLVGVSSRDLTTKDKLPVHRATLRGVIIVIEMVASVTVVLAVVPLAELLVLMASGRTVTDRVLGVDICAHRVATPVPGLPPPPVSSTATGT